MAQMPTMSSIAKMLGLLHQRSRTTALVLLMVVAMLLSMNYFATHTDFVAMRQPNVDRPADTNVRPEFPRVPELEARSMEAAGNSTLGFHSIRFINMKHRYDRMDAVVLQAYVAGVEIEEFPAVMPDMIKEVGMPPTSSPHRLSMTEKACYRAHANVWSEIVQKRLPPVLILESDAAWDLNVRPIMATFNQNFVRYLHDLNSKGREVSFFSADADPARDPHPPVQFDPHDPWLSEHWDILSLGHCNENAVHTPTELYRKYPDPWVVSGYRYSEKLTLGKERVIRQSGGIVCLTSYAVSQRGAARLLTRHGLDLDEPVDMVIMRMIERGQLLAYVISPMIMAQWTYIKDIGMDHGNSDIADVKPVDVEMPGWEEAHNKKSVWQISHKYDGLQFSESALNVTWKKFFGDDDLAFRMPSIPGMSRQQRKKKPAPVKDDNPTDQQTE